VTLAPAIGTMGDDLKSTLETLMANMQTLQSAVQANAAAIQALADRSSSSSNGPRPNTCEHHTDRPPRFQKMDFPRYDGKSNPHLHQPLQIVLSSAAHHRGKKVWMASYNLEEGAQMWYIQIQQDEGGIPT
jgi:hypothetical protein